MKKAILATIAIAVATASLSANSADMPKPEPEKASNFMFRSPLPGVKAGGNGELGNENGNTNPESDNDRELSDWEQFAVDNWQADESYFIDNEDTADYWNYLNVFRSSGVQPSFDYFPASDVNNLFINNASLISIKFLSNVSSAQMIDLSRNQLEDANFSAVYFPADGSLILNNNILESVSLPDVGSIGSIDLGYNNLSAISIPSSMHVVKGTLNLSHNNLNSVGNLGNLDSATAIYLNGNSNLRDISSLGDISLSGALKLDSDIASRTGFVPLPSGSYLCMPVNKGMIYGPEQEDICG